MDDLPPRLSDRQRFILALLVAEPAALSYRGSDPKLRSVSIRVADEFDEWKPRRLGSGENVTENHSSTFSRSVARLEERGLLRRHRTERRRRETERTDTVTLIDAGQEAGEEILRRVRDGRFSDSFATLDRSSMAESEPIAIPLDLIRTTLDVSGGTEEYPDSVLMIFQTRVETIINDELGTSGGDRERLQKTGALLAAAYIEDRQPMQQLKQGFRSVSFSTDASLSLLDQAKQMDPTGGLVDLAKADGDE